MWKYNINQKNQVQSCPKTRSRKFSWLFILEDLLWESRAIIENDTFTQKIASESLINMLHKQRKIYLLLEFLVRCSLFFILVFGTDNSFWQLHAFTVPWNKKFFKELIFAPAVGKIHKTTLHNIFFFVAMDWKNFKSGDVIFHKLQRKSHILRENTFFFWSNLF